MIEKYMTRKVTPAVSSICHARNGVFCDEEKILYTCPGQSTENVHFRNSCLNSTVTGILATTKMHVLFVAVMPFHTSDYVSATFVRKCLTIGC
jgi:hypothetical protein